MISLERRLDRGLAASLVLLLALLWVVTTLSFRHVTERLIESRLQHDAEELLAVLAFDQGRPLLDEQRIGAIYHRPLSGHYYLLLCGGPPLRSRSLWDGDLPLTPLAPGERRTLHLPGPTGEPLLGYAAGFRKQEQQVTVLVAEEISRLSRRIAIFDYTFAAVSLLVLAALLLVQRLIVRRTLASLTQVRGDLERLERGEAAALPEAVPLEIAPLVQEVNRLLRQNAERLARSRNALGNLAHALKHPLALLASVADRQRGRDAPLAAEIDEPVQRLSRLIDGELKRARFAGAGEAGRRCVPAEELPALVALLERIHRQKPLAISWQAPPGRGFPVDRDDLLELLGNLLDNACKWARSQVSCTIADAAGLHILIEDDGPGLSPEEAARLTTRGSRLDEAVPGHGLGLAIVADLVRLYGGRLEFGRAQLGGLRVVVVMPGAGS